MINYIKAECGRLSKKKSNYIFYASLMVLFSVITVFIKGDNRTSNNFFTMINSMLPMVMMILTVQTFITVYSDDVSGKVLATSLSSGVSKANLVISKVIVSVIYSFVVFAVLGLFLIIHLFLFGGSFNKEGIDFLTLMVKQSFVIILAMTTFGILGSTVLYLSQKSTIGITFLTVLTFGILTQIVSLLTILFKPLQDILVWFPDSLYQNLYTGLMGAQFEIKYVVALFVYLVIGIILSVVILRKKELEI